MTTPADTPANDGDEFAMELNASTTETVELVAGTRAMQGMTTLAATAMDFSGARPPVDQVDVIFRYLSRSGGPKVLTADEAHAYIAMGKGIALNFEDDADNAKRGAQQGIADATFANDLADELGAPNDVWVWYSCDTAATFNDVLPYYQAIRDVGRRPAAFYGGLHVGLELQAAGIVAGVWCANAASWSGYRSWHAMAPEARQKAHVLQHVDHPLAGIEPKAYDYNEVFIPFPTWGGAVPAPAPSIPEAPLTTVATNKTKDGRVGTARPIPALGAIALENGASLHGDLPAGSGRVWINPDEVVRDLQAPLVDIAATVGPDGKPDGRGIVALYDLGASHGGVAPYVVPWS